MQISSLLAKSIGSDPQLKVIRKSQDGLNMRVAHGKDLLLQWNVGTILGKFSFMIQMMMMTIDILVHT